MVGRTTETGQKDDPANNTIQLGKRGACIGTHEPALVLLHHGSPQLPSSEKDRITTNTGKTQSFTNTGQRTRRKFQNSDQLHSQLRQTRAPTQGRRMEINGTTYSTHLSCSKNNGRIIYGITRSQLHQIGRQDIHSSSKKTI